MSLRNVQKSKSRSKLWDALSGVNELTGAAGTSANWTIQFPNLAAAGDTVTVGPYVFQFVADGSEDTAGDSAGTAADPHLITIGGTPSATTAATALTAALLAETETTGAWGFLHPVNATGASSSTDTVTINFFPGTFANAATYITTSSDGTEPTVANVSDGTTLPVLNTDVKWNILDTTGFSTTNKQYYYLPDGKEVGEECGVLIKTITSSDTPTIVGSLTDGGTDQVEALFAALEDSGATFMWNGARWSMTNENPAGTITFDAAT